jgi:putative two-component system response regulator
MVVEDDFALAELVRDLLSEEGFEARVCSNWRKAHASIAAERPDVVLLDVCLGDADHGWRVLDKLTLDPATRHTPVILWSRAHEELHAHAPVLLPEHGIFVMTKPFDVEVLLQTIAKALKLRPPVIGLNAARRARKQAVDATSLA